MVVSTITRLGQNVAKCRRALLFSCKAINKQNIVSRRPMSADAEVSGMALTGTDSVVMVGIAWTATALGLGWVFNLLNPPKETEYESLTWGEFENVLKTGRVTGLTVKEDELFRIIIQTDYKTAKTLCFFYDFNPSDSHETFSAKVKASAAKFGIDKDTPITYADA